MARIQRQCTQDRSQPLRQRQSGTLWCPSNRWSGRAGALCTNNRSHPFLRPGFEHHVEGPLRGASNMAEAAALLQHLGQLRLSRLGAETLADLLRE
jgi:hypothetical protein